MGSMIGSGIFIVSAEIARLVDSPALLIAAWLVTGFMTITGALAYGELAAMMPHAGGQYVYLRESLGPLVGISLRLDAIPGHPDRDHRRGRCGLRQVSGRLLSFRLVRRTGSCTSRTCRRFPIGPMVLGNMDVGLNTQNLVAILVVIFLSVLNIFGVRTGAAVQNVFTFAKTAALLGLVLLGIFIGRNAQAIAANFGANFWRNAGWSALHPVQVGVGGPIALVGTITIIAVAQVGSLFSADAWNNVTFTAGEVRNPQRNLPLSLAIGTGAVILLVCAGELGVPERAAAGGRSQRHDDSGARHSARLGRPRRDRGDAADLRSGRRADHGRRHPDLHLRLQQRTDSGGRARVLRHGEGRTVLHAARPNCIPSTTPRRTR